MEFDNITLNATETDIQSRKDLCNQYIKFISDNKIEMDVVHAVLCKAIASGYKNYIPGQTELKEGGKYYYNVKGKACILFTLADILLEEGFNILCPHIDSPRIDLKPNPLYEDGEIGLLKGHSYGGLKNFQWVTIPLEMRGRIWLKDDKSIDCTEYFKDYTFMISDILPHLSDEQDKREAYKAVKNEELNIVIGSYQIGDKDDDEKVKKNILKILESHGITEKDLLSADIEFVPKFNAEYLGFDKSLIGGYGQDDKVCTWAALTAELTSKKKTSSFIIFADKEEIGSEGITGAQSNFWTNVLKDICTDLNVRYTNVVRKSIFIVADVNAGFDPTWEGAFEKTNSAHINHGVCIQKCCGGVGKYEANETNGRCLRAMMNILDTHDIKYQVTEMGALDTNGGGSTISAYSAREGFESFDIGTPILSMHSPFEVCSVFDVCETYLAYKSILENRNEMI